MILVLGAKGQVGSALQFLLSMKSKGAVRALDRTEADLLRPDTLPAVLDQYKPTVVINAAAYTAVDLAEKEKESAEISNAVSPGVIAEWCARNQAKFVHFSTDYVFPGTGEAPWTEEDPVHPLGVYGATKLAGEKAIQNAMGASGQYLIFRTSWVYDGSGKNFYRTMLKLAGEREQLKIVNDQFGAPTYAPQLARAVLQALDATLNTKPFPSGVYHLCHAGTTTWYEFAQTIFAGARERGVALTIKQVDPIPSSEYPTPAQRPKNSRLSNEKVQRVFGVRMPDWKDGLRACMATLSKEQTQ